MHILRKEQLQNFEIIGASCHSIDDIIETQKLGAKYVVLGNIYETDCKKGFPGKGPGLLREACSVSSVPVYAIGGITPERMHEIIACCAECGCMVSGFMK